MTDTINNVPRDDLDLIRAALEGFKPCIARDDALRTVRALLSAPSPAGVDGLSVVAVVNSDDCTTAGYGHLLQAAPDGEELCRLSDAQAIIDGLRGELEAAGEILAQQGRRNTELRKMRDQKAQRIGELEGLLRSCLPALSDGGCAALANRIDAALSAGKEGE